MFNECVNYTKIIQDNDIFISLIPIINEHIELNHSLDGSFSGPFLSYLKRIQLLSNKDHFQSMIEYISKLLHKDQHQFFIPRMIPKLVSIIGSQSMQLNLNFLYIICKCSQLSNDSLVTELFIGIPLILYKKLEEMPVITDKSMFIEIPKDNNQPIQRETPDSFIMPDPTIIKSTFNISELCNSYFQGFLQSFLPMLEIISNESANIIISSILALKDQIMKSNHTIDFIIIILLLLKILTKKVSFEKITPLLINEITFNPEVNIFTSIGIKPQVNTLRNEIFDLFVNYSEKTFQKLLKEFNIDYKNISFPTFE